MVDGYCCSLFVIMSIIKIKLEIYPEEKKLSRMLSLPPCYFFSTRNLTFILKNKVLNGLVFFYFKKKNYISI